MYAGKIKPLQLGDLYILNESIDGAEIQPQEETNLVHGKLTKLPQDDSEANPPETKQAHDERSPPESSALQAEVRQPGKDGDKIEDEV